MIPRYSRKVMARIWTEENKFLSWLKVELAAMAAMANCGLIPMEAARRARRKAKIDVARILEIEAKTHHDVAAFVDQVAAGLGEDGRYFHFGLTSSDVLDTALGLRLAEAADVLASDLDELLAVLKEKAYAFKDQAMVGRTQYSCMPHYHTRYKSYYGPAPWLRKWPGNRCQRILRRLRWKPP